METSETKPEQQQQTVIKNQTVINNVRNGPMTTILGSLIILVVIGLFVAPVFVNTKLQIPYPILGIAAVVGFALLFVPDKFIGGIGKVVSRKSDEI